MVWAPLLRLAGGFVNADAAEDMRTSDRTERWSQSVATGAQWSLISLAVKQGGRIVSSFLLARLLGPESYGVVGMVTIYISLVWFFLDWGLGAVLVQRESLRSEDVASVFWLNLVSSVGIAFLTFILAAHIARFFSAPALSAVLQVLSIAVVLKAMSVVPVALLTREMRFRELAIIEAVGTFLGSIAAVVVALRGGSYWSIVVQIYVIDALNLVWLTAIVGLPVLRFSMSSLASLWSFSANVGAGQLLTYGHRNLDNILVGRFLGAASLAYYSVAYRFMLLPMQTLGQVAHRVLFPAFSRLQRDISRLKGYLLRATSLLAIVVFPALTLLILTAPKLIPLVLGEDWVAAVAPTQILAVVGMVQMVQLHSLIFLATGRAHWDLRFTLATTFVSTIAFVAGLPWGVVGVAAAYLGSNLLLWPVSVVLVGRVVGMRTREYVGALMPAIVGTLALVAAWAVADAVSSPSMSTGPYLLATASSGVIGFLIAVRLVFPSDWTKTLMAAKAILSPGRLGLAPSAVPHAR